MRSIVDQLVNIVGNGLKKQVSKYPRIRQVSGHVKEDFGNRLLDGCLKISKTAHFQSLPD
jgi:hypothetical protein